MRHQPELDHVQVAGPSSVAVASPERWRSLVSRMLVPLIAIGLFGLAIWTIHHSIAAIRFSQIRHEIKAIPNSVLLLAGGLTCGSFLALAFQDYVALWSTGKRIAFGRALLGSYIAQSVAHSTGFSMLIGGALRCRYYMSEGLSFADTMKVQLSFSGTFGMATCILLGLSFLLDPSLAAAQTAFLPEGLVRAIGVLLLLGPAGVFVWRSVHVGPLKFFGRQIDMPDTRHLLPQTLLSLTDVSCMGAVLYVFLPPELHISYPALIGLFAIAMTIGVTSHVPGGLGVFEAAILLLVSPPAELLPALVSALVMFRFMYYFLPLVGGGVAVALAEGLRHRGRLRALTESAAETGSPVVPMVFAMLVFMSGVFMLASSALPGSSWRITFLSNFLPQSVLETSHVLSAVFGTLLLLLGRALSRRLAEAWWVAEILLACSAVVALTKGLEYEVAGLFALLFLALLPCRPQFYRGGRLIDQRLTPMWMLGISAIVLLMCWLLAFVYRHLDYTQSALLQFELQRHASRSLRAMVAMLVTLAAALIWQSWRALQHRVATAGDPDHRRLRSVVAQSPRSSAHLVLTGDKSLLWNTEMTACLAYGTRGRTLIGIGDPIGPQGTWSDLIWDLRDLAERQNGRVAFFDVGGGALPAYFDLGLQAVPLGTRAYLSLADTDPEVWLNTAIPGARLPQPGTAITVEVLRRDQVDHVMSDLATISDLWRDSLNIHEQHLIQGRFSRDYVAHCPVAVLRQRDRIIAFAVIWCGAGKDECEIDLLRWLPASPGDTPYLLLAGILAWARAEGYKSLDLGLEPLESGQDPRLAALWHELAQGRLQQPQPDMPARPVSAAALLLAGQAELPITHEASYLLHPMGHLPQTQRDLIDLIATGRASA